MLSLQNPAREDALYYQYSDVRYVVNSARKYFEEMLRYDDNGASVARAMLSCVV
jgi:hypothetical protein